MKPFERSNQSNDEESWVSVSDMMAGLMMVFLLIAITYMIQISKEKNEAVSAFVHEKEAIVNIAKEYAELKNDIYDNLYEEFKHDFINWNATIDRQNLSIKFAEPNIYFDQSSTVIKENFKDILINFFPRYLKLLFLKYKNDIDEVRIEGHTSSEWKDGTNPEQAYIENMKLSQDRARNVLQFVIGLVADGEKEWLIKHLTANGLSSSRLENFNGTKIEDKKASRRVEFRIKTKTEERLGVISTK